MSAWLCPAVCAAAFASAVGAAAFVGRRRRRRGLERRLRELGEGNGRGN
jgi:hypothetical protein